MSVGLICEFNPFHYGHQYIIDKIHELTGEPVICIMSGPFVQRAEPACTSKYARTKAALLGGADAVIELPVKYAVASAKNFAIGGVNVLKNIQGVTALAFGVETDNTELLFKIAQIKKQPQTDMLIKEELSQGISYPNAIANAIAKNSDDEHLYKDILSKPNNILAIEYIEALDGSNIKPLPIRRIGSGYNEKNLNNSFASATAIRQSITQGEYNLEKYLPEFMLERCKNSAPDYKLLDSLILYALRKLSIEDLRDLPFAEPGLEYSIKKASSLPTAAEALEAVKTKRYTYSRLKRIFLYALLGINKHIMSDINSAKTRVLGIKKEFKSFFANLNSNIITRNSDASPDFCNEASVKIDAFAEDVYSILTGSSGNLYYKEPMIII